MNRAELVGKVHDSMGGDVNKRQVEDMLNLTFNLISYAVAKGDDVKVLGFGTFVKTKRKSRMRINPQTGAKLKIQAHWAVKFRVHEALKHLVREGGIL